jgi:hypothetical protein
MAEQKEKKEEELQLNSPRSFSSSSLSAIRVMTHYLSSVTGKNLSQASLSSLSFLSLFLSLFPYLSLFVSLSLSLFSPHSLTFKSFKTNELQ